MEIKYLGHASFQIKTSTAKIVMDPFDPAMMNLKYPKVDADILTVSHGHPDHNYIKGVNGDPLVLDWPGEFEKNSVRVFGFKSYHDKQKGAERGENILYKFEAEGISVLHCGDLGVMLDDSFIENMGTVDIMMVPVGGFFTIDSSEAANLVKKVEPSIVIPMHYNRDEFDQSKFGSMTPLATFLEKMGVSPEPVDKLVVKKEDIGEEMKVVVMNITS